MNAQGGGALLFPDRVFHPVSHLSHLQRLVATLGLYFGSRVAI